MKPSIATVKLRSASSLIFGRAFESQKKAKESHDDFEKRCCRERVHADENGMVFLPETWFTKALQSGAQHASNLVKYPGKGSWTKHFLRGAWAVGNIPMNIHEDKLPVQKMYVPAQPGNKASKTRVWKYFPMLPAWEGTATFYIMDPLINEDVFKKMLEATGMFIGLGAMRAEGGNSNGRFLVDSIDWIDGEVE